MAVYTHLAIGGGHSPAEARTEGLEDPTDLNADLDQTLAAIG